MARSIRFVLALTLLLALTIASAAQTLAGGRKVLDSTMTGLPTGSLVVDGVTGGGVPWSISDGHVVLFADGRLHVEVEGLVITATGVNPVTTGKAVLACGDAPVASTDVVPFSSTGDATIDTVIDLPSQCLAPAVFFTSATGRWFAVTGF
ncbi:MAG TPA: hypothetical protein VHR16_01580 [Candidatus Limnocylindrales bacterium]|jgi:hypothetical protein|nr:hypothetical protein [Candidatus Limnocylindrales bacterium]